MQVIIGTMPMSFPGTTEEIRANEDTHFFIYDGDECPRCGGCDCRMGGTSSQWPCGADVPRVAMAKTPLEQVRAANARRALVDAKNRVRRIAVAGSTDRLSIDNHEGGN